MRDRAEDFVGKKINNILITGHFRENKRTFFNCICFCGETFTARMEAIKDGATRSCGCITGMLIAQKTSNIMTPVKSLFRCYRDNARKRDIIFNISLDDFIPIISQNCYYCNIPPEQTWIANRERKNYCKEPLIYNGVDRMNSDIGYELSNIVPACITCNGGKGNLPYENFMEWITRIVKYQKYTFDHKPFVITNISENSQDVKIITTIENDNNIRFDTNYILKKGDVFGYLTFIEKVNTLYQKKHKCVCVCGNIIYLDKSDLLKGSHKSCGCMKGAMHSIKITKPDGYFQYNNIFGAYRSGARRRNIDFSLSFNEIKSIISNNCYYCDLPPQPFNMTGRERRHNNSPLIYHNGIDRIDPTKSYQIYNCVPCCTTCNRVKSDLSYSNFIIYINRLITKYDEL